MESRAGATSEESAELKKLRREVAELRRANDIFGIDENLLPSLRSTPGSAAAVTGRRSHSSTTSTPVSWTGWPKAASGPKT
ncbi:MAG: hypothetical protein V7646_1952 [Pseudonocardia sp.]|jgi:hypothetical protein